MSRLRVDFGRLVRAFSIALFVLFILSLATLPGTGLAPFTFAAIAGAIGGGIVAAIRSERGLGASLTSEPPSSHPATINMSHIPVSGIGGLGLLAMAIGVALILPDGRQLMGWGIVGAAVGAGAFIAWRHLHGGSPFAEHPEETLHLR